MTTRPPICHSCPCPRWAGAVFAVALVALAPTAATGSQTSQTSLPGEDGSSDPASAEHDDVTTADEQSDQPFDEGHRHELYRKGKLDYQTAALRTALLPGLGNFYARQYFIGGLNASLLAFTAVLVPYGLATYQPGFAWAGLGVAGAAYLSGFVTSAIGVRQYNRKLRRRLRLTEESEPAGSTPFAAPDAPTVGISIPF